MPTDAVRRLATIVAVDACGYSHQSEIDETVAVREITALTERVATGAASHGGRVFNTAGDGFMLEFASPSGALACAEELLANARVPLRIGIHLGEVSEAPGGDLLGRGVNVAARLRELAEPGGLRVSGEVRSALPAPGGQRLSSRGAVRLSKMDEKVETFAIAGAWRERPWHALLRNRTVLLAAAAVAAAIGVTALAPRLLRQENERVAVLDFDTLGDASLTSFSEGLSSQVVGVMSISDLQAIPPAQSEQFREGGLGASARRAAAGFVLDGAVRQEAGALHVNMHIVDARTDTTLWSNEYRRNAREGVQMQEQLASHVADVLRCALVSRRPRAGEIDPETLGIFLRACDRMQRFDQGPEEMYEAARQITERAPRFSRGWSMLAMACALASGRVPPERSAELQQQARDAAERARALDRENAESDLALALILPSSAWRERHELLHRALEKDPDSPEANVFTGNFYSELGRLEDALVYYRRAAAIDPLSPVTWAAIVPTLTASGARAEAQAMRERMYRVWPDSRSVWFNRFTNAMFAGESDIALSMLDTVDTAPIVMEQPMRAAWRSFLVAMRDNNRAGLRAAVNNLAAMARRGALDMPRAISSASLAGEIDTGFALSEEYFGGGFGGALNRLPVASGHRYFLFLGPGRAMRRDPRFIGLARELGLVEYWTETGDWPDFCAEPDLPYDCRVEAARPA
ncbi:MAG: hypothetical protein AB7T59_11925 [Hyphomonadaceae bacterium]